MQTRRERVAAGWNVSIDEWRETETAFVGFGHRDAERVVLKVIKEHCDEWHSGDVLRAFDGHGFVRVLELEDGAMLLERAEPGTELVELVRAGRDVEATEIVARVIGEMRTVGDLAVCPTIVDWGRSFAKYRATNDAQLPADLVDQAERMFLDLSASQRRTRLLHGDLHHYNILEDRRRGWLAIDPKGVIGELEYEIGAVLRNPGESRDLLTHPAVIRRRIDQLSSALGLDADRVLRWAFAQAVLSAIWTIEDAGRVESRDPALLLAMAVRPLLKSQ